MAENPNIWKSDSGGVDTGGSPKWKLYGGATSPRKVYLVDNGMAMAARPHEPDLGRRFEKHVFRWLIDRGVVPKFGKTDSGEGNFVFDRTSVQACFSLRGAGATREVDALDRAAGRGARAILLLRDSRGVDPAAVLQGVTVLDYRDIFRDSLSVLPRTTAASRYPRSA